MYDYQNDERTRKGKDNDGKNLYAVIISNVEKSGMSEEDFIKYIADDIYEYENPTKFVASLKKLLA